MIKRTLLFGICLLLFVPAALAQDVPDDIDDFDGDFEEVLEQLADDDYIDEDEGELLFEDNRVNFDDEDDDFRFFNFHDDFDVENLVMAGTLELNADDDSEESEFCVMTLRDTQEGFIGVGLNSFGFYIIIDQVFEDDDPLFVVDEYDDNDDNEAHLIVMLLEDEITVYINGELVYADDDFSEREGTFGFLRSVGSDCQLEDVWVWEIESTSSSSDDDEGDEDDEEDSRGGIGGALGGGDDDDDSDEDNEDDEEVEAFEAEDFPDELDSAGDDPDDVIEELIDSGAIADADLLFEEDSEEISDLGYFVTTIGEDEEAENVILAGDLEFNSESDEYEFCTIGGRHAYESDTSTTITQYISAGYDNEGDTFLLYNGDGIDGPLSIDLDIEVDIDDEINITMILNDEEVTVYIDGELVLDREELFSEEGFYSVGLLSEDEDSNCEVTNFWVAEISGSSSSSSSDDDDDDTCLVSSSNNVNQRSGPGTTFGTAGTLSAGEEIEVVAETTGSDGFVWYQLDDESYVRSDVVSLNGDCDDLPEADD